MGFSDTFNRSLMKMRNRVGAALFTLIVMAGIQNQLYLYISHAFYSKIITDYILSIGSLDEMSIHKQFNMLFRKIITCFTEIIH